jgi:hypothetical protein
MPEEATIMKYKVIKTEWTPDGMDCEHALCDPLHKRWHKRSGLSWYCAKPMAPRTEWLIQDTETDEFITVNGEGRFDLRRDAVEALKEYMSGNYSY